MTSAFEDANITPSANSFPCEPPLPMFYVTIMAYPCERRCVGVVTAQLYEVARPERIDEELSGVWQAVTWERQELVSSLCDDFAEQIDATVTGMTAAFVERFQHDNPTQDLPCFPER